jgi:hypothetical protein
MSAMASSMSTGQPAWQQRPAPPELALLQQFLNTHRYSAEPDQFATPASARRWLRAQGLPAFRVGSDQLHELLELREAVRTLLLRRSGHDPARPNGVQLGRMLRRAPLRIDFDEDGRAHLTSHATSAGCAGQLPLKS